MSVLVTITVTGVLALGWLGVAGLITYRGCGVGYCLIAWAGTMYLTGATMSMAVTR